MANARAMKTSERTMPGRGAMSDKRGQELQRFGDIRPMPIGLNEEARAQSIEAINKPLADSIILYNLYKKHHWLMRGPTFYQLHLLLDKHAGEQLALIDLMGERVQTLGGVAVADPRHVAELTTVERPPNGAEEVPIMLDRLLDAHQVVIEGVRRAIDLTNDNKDWGTNDLMMGDVLRTNELQAWFIAEHLVDTPVVQ